MLNFFKRLFAKPEAIERQTPITRPESTPPEASLVPPVIPTPVLVYTRPLKLGSSGDDVLAGKRILKLHGYNVGELTAEYNRAMDQAVRDFQRANELTVDGVIGPVGAAHLSSEGIVHANDAEKVEAGIVPEALGAAGEGLLKIPSARQSLVRMKTRGKYAGGYPWGAVVHYTAGSRDRGFDDAREVIEQGIKNGFTYLAIAADGTVIQAHPINEWGYHAGESRWPGLGTGVSAKLIGIEVCNPGILTRKPGNKFETWYGEPVAEPAVRYVEEAKWGCPTGWYLPYTPEQEIALENLLIWLKRNDPTGRFSFDNVLGHHEVSGKRGIGRWRKSDPGGALSTPMEQFRKRLKGRG